MKRYISSKLLLHDKFTDEEGGIKEYVVWSVPRGSQYPEGVRYRLAFIPRGAIRPAVLFDNHHPKGHHRHLETIESPYVFTDVRKLLKDFADEVARLQRRRGQ